MSSELKVMQFNLRDPKECDRKSGNHWDGRKELVGDFIRNSGAALICLVECVDSMEPDIKKRLVGSPYTFHTTSGQRNRLVYDSSLVRVVNQNPPVPLPKNHGLKNRYHYLEVYDMELLSTRDRFRFICTHFIYNSESARAESGKILAKQVGACRELTHIVCGDANAKKSSAACKNAQGGGLLKDAVETAAHKQLSSSTWAGWKPASSNGTSASGHIDWIFYHNGNSMHLQPLKACTPTEALRGKRTLSDHHPVVVTFGITNSCRGALKRPRTSDDSSDGRDVSKRLLGLIPIPVTSDDSRGVKTWKTSKGRNCWNGRGGSNVDEKKDNRMPLHMSVDEAKRLCVEKGYAGFTYRPSEKRMWRLKHIDNPEKFKADGRFEVYWLSK